MPTFPTPQYNMSHTASDVDAIKAYVWSMLYLLDPDATEFRPGRPYHTAHNQSTEQVAAAMQDSERWEQPTGIIISDTPGMQGALSSVNLHN